MSLLLRLLSFEEGGLSSDEQMDVSNDMAYEAVTLTLEDEAQLCAYLAMANEDEDVTIMQERMICVLQFVAPHVLSSGAKTRAQMIGAIEKLYRGERQKDVLLDGQIGVERAFIQRIFHHVSNSKAANLKEQAQKNKTLKMHVLKEPNAARFVKKELATFRRLAQLCQSTVAEQFENERLFPGDVEKERAILHKEIINTWANKNNYHLEDAMLHIWNGVRELDILSASLDSSDYGSRYCIWQVLQLCQQFGVSHSSPKPTVLIETPKASASVTKGLLQLAKQSFVISQGEREKESKFAVRKLELGQSDEAAMGVCERARGKERERVCTRQRERLSFFKFLKARNINKTSGGTRASC